nr:S8 family serine peptidase [uncultured Actinoplanes sp.]
MKGNRRKLKVGLFTVAVVAGAGVTVPALADTEPDVRLIVGLEAADRTGTAKDLGALGYRLRTQGRLEQLGARTLAVPQDDAAKIAAKLRNQDGVAFVEVDRKVKVLGEEDGASPSPSPSESDSPAPDESPSPAPSEPVAGEDPSQPEGEPSSPAATDEPAPTVEPTPTEEPPPPPTWDALGQLGLPAAWASSATWTSQTVAVVDTGVTPVGELDGSVLPGVNVVGGAADPADATDDSVNGHGTAVASLVKASCPACKILPVKAIDRRGAAFDSEVAQGIIAAADRGARVINLSFGAPVQPGTPDPGALLQSAVDYARGKGAVVVAATGNDARGDLKYYPAANNGVLGVGGTNAAGGRYTKADDPAGEAGTSYGPGWVDVAAPFCATALTTTGAGQQVCGTSYSAALASGIAGLVKSRTAAANSWSIENALTSTATVPGEKWLTYGEIRADRAVAKVDTTAPVVGATTPNYMQRVRGTVAVAASKVTDAGGGYPAGSGADHAWLYADGRYIGSDYSAPFAVNYNSAGRNGTVKLQWKVWDRAGNLGILNRNIVADNTAPTLTWTTGPANNAKVKGTVTVSAKATDAGGVWRVELWINGKLTQWDWTSGYSFKVNTARYGSTIKVQLRARDQVGNYRTLPTRTWKR